MTIKQKLAELIDIENNLVNSRPNDYWENEEFNKTVDLREKIERAIFIKRVTLDDDYEELMFKEVK